MGTISCAGVTVTFGGRAVVDDVSLDVEAGEWLSIIGPNGAGKSTLLKVLAGLQPSSGSVELASEPIAGMNRRQVARAVALVPQSPVLPLGMTVADYALLGRTPYSSWLGAESPEDLTVVAEVLDVLELTDLRDRELTTLSGGERQRAILARALTQRSTIVLLDEPTTALDVGHQQDVLEMVAALRHLADLTVVAVLHDLTVAGQYSDRVLMLSDGRAVRTGPPEEVMSEGALNELFGANVRVVDSPSGRVVVPVRPAEGWVPSPRSSSSEGER